MSERFSPAKDKHIFDANSGKRLTIWLYHQGSKYIYKYKIGKSVAE